jgi:uncharacterized protein
VADQVERPMVNATMHPTLHLPTSTVVPATERVNGMVAGPSTAEREAVRQLPSGWPVMHQTWDKLLFMHWPIDIARLRPLIPSGLEIDTWNGTAWLGITPLTIYSMRPPFLPAVPLVSSTHELNIRTYVFRDNVPGVWFFSLDASNWLAVFGARLGYSLPYFHSRISLTEEGNRIHFDSRRSPSTTPAELHATWQAGSRLPETSPDTLDFFLTERYCLYSASRRGLYRARIHHRPWPLCTAHLEAFRSTVAAADGLVDPAGEPVLHAQADPLDVWVWPPEKLDE